MVGSLWAIIINIIVCRWWQKWWNKPKAFSFHLMALFNERSTIGSRTRHIVYSGLRMHLSLLLPFNHIEDQNESSQVLKLWANANFCVATHKIFHSKTNIKKELVDYTECENIAECIIYIIFMCWMLEIFCFHILPLSTILIL